jgi:hypothetical protein
MLLKAADMAVRHKFFFWRPLQDMSKWCERVMRVWIGQSGLDCGLQSGREIGQSGLDYVLQSGADSWPHLLKFLDSWLDWYKGKNINQFFKSV